LAIVSAELRLPDDPQKAEPNESDIITAVYILSGIVAGLRVSVGAEAAGGGDDGLSDEV
jgi:hypothetical protein